MKTFSDHQPAFYTAVTNNQVDRIIHCSSQFESRAHVFRKVPVNMEILWNKGIDECAPKTPNDNLVRKPIISTQYRGTREGCVTRDIVLVSCPSLDSGLDWIDSFKKETRLRDASPREVFAICRDLVDSSVLDLRKDGDYCVCSPIPSTFGGRENHMCSVCYKPGSCIVDLLPFNPLRPNAWYAFVVNNR